VGGVDKRGEIQWMFLNITYIAIQSLLVQFCW